VLHDTVEDTDVSFESLEEEGFSERVVSAVRALTKHSGETRLEAARRAVLDPIARAVKLCDVADNMDLSRISNPNDQDFLRMKEYEEVRAILLSGP
jgi:(p)ppGpp synthase/HD superfamily hydrolase